MARAEEKFRSGRRLGEQSEEPLNPKVLIELLVDVGHDPFADKATGNDN
jgi:hypothetical protein